MENQIKEYEQTIDQFTLIKRLGIGYTAQVKLGRNPQGRHVAIKQYKLEQSALQIMQNQLTIMKQLHHNNIIGIISVREGAVYKKGNEINETCFAVILEYAEEGELFDYILETGRLNEFMARAYFKELMDGLGYIHEKGYSHRDLKLQNLLLSAQFVLKVADFGYSCLLKGHDGFGVLKTRVGTQGYMAPQVFANQYDGKKIDIFSAGVILFILHSGNPPFQKATTNDPHYKLIKQKRFTLFWQAHSKRRSAGFFSQSFKDLIQNMLAFQQNERISIQKITNHEWMKGQTSTHEQILQQFTFRKQKLLKRREQKKKRWTEQKKRRNQNIHNQGSNTRAPQTKEDKQFLQIYNKQQLQPLKLQEYQYCSQEDIIIKQTDLLYTRSLLKHYLTKHRVPLYEEQQSQEIITQGPQQWICQSINTMENKIQIKYRLSEHFNHQNITSELILDICLGMNCGQGLLRFQRVAGCEFYYRKVVNDIRNECLA